MATDRQKFLEIYHTSGNSARRTAEALGISVRSVYNMLSRIDKGEQVISDRMRSKVDLNINPFYHGTNDAEIKSTKEGEGWRIERYTLKPGDKLPDSVLKGKDNEFMVKMKQSQGQGESWVSTGYSQSFDSAMNGATALAAKYKKFHAGEVEVDVFIPDEDYDPYYEEIIPDEWYEDADEDYY